MDIEEWEKRLEADSNAFITATTGEEMSDSQRE
jgi:hypothetical protein